MSRAGAAYRASLEEGWRQAMAERAADAPKVVSVFAGCGGSSLGYRMAGFKTMLAVEWDAHAAACYRDNFPTTNVYEGDIAGLATEDALARTGLAPGELDVFDGSPPCQGFSTAGKRMIDDARNGLFREYVRLLDAFKPKVLVMENVTGLVKGKMRLTFAEILREIESHGYDARARVLDARWFGVPQARQRVIIVGVRRDLKRAPCHPTPTTIRPFTAAEAIEDVPNDTLVALPIRGKLAAVAVRMRPGQTGQDVTGNAFFNYVRFDPHRPAPTIVKTGAFGNWPVFFHWTEMRGFTIAEAKRFQSFPDAYELRGPWKDAWARIGNSVAPLFMRAVASEIRRSILSPSEALLTGT